MSEAAYELKITAEGEARDADGRLLDADGNPVEPEPDAVEDNEDDQPQEAS
jgi:hypothetical protein